MWAWERAVGVVPKHCDMLWLSCRRCEQAAADGCATGARTRRQCCALCQLPMEQLAIVTVVANAGTVPARLLLQQQEQLRVSVAKPHCQLAALGGGLTMAEEE